MMIQRWLWQWRHEAAGGNAIATVLTTALLAAGGGCYEHVIRVEGPGADNYEIHEPNLSDKPGPIEQLIWGEQQADEGDQRSERTGGTQK